MKKFYSLLLAVAATAMVATAAPAKAPALKLDPAFQAVAVTASDVVSAAAPATKVNKTFSKAIAKAAESTPEVEVGAYFMSGLNPNGNMMMLGCEIKAGEGEGNYILTTELDETVEIPCTAAYQQLSDGTQTYNFPMLTIEGQGKLKFATMNDTDYYVWAVGLSNGNFVRYSDNIDLLILPGGELTPLYQDFGLGYLSTDGYGGGFVSEYQVLLKNANMGWTQTTNTSKEQEMDLHVFVDGTNSKLYITGLYGFMTEVEMDIDLEGNAVTANSQTLTSITGEDDTEYELVLATAPGDGYIYPMGVFEIQPEGDMTYLVNVYDQYLYCLSDNEDYAGWYYKYTNTEIELEFDLATAGVKEVAVAAAEADLNAPVEYFNLQGVRVAEPAAGLYIRRQGNAVSKVVIR